MEKLHYIARHAESVGNRNYELGIPGENYPLGTPLSEQGIGQAENIAKHLKHMANIQIIYTSDLQRSLQTANIIKETLQVPVYVTPQLRERKKDVRLKEETDHTDPLPDQTFNTLTVRMSHEIESKQEALNRFMDFMKYLSTQKENETLIISHSVIMRALLVYLQHGTIDEYQAGTITNTGCIKLMQTEDNLKILNTFGIKK